MDETVIPDSIYARSDDIVAREIEGEIIIIPLVAGIADMEDELFSLNETGRAIWGLLDGQRSLRAITDLLSREFDAPASDIERDVTGFVQELAKRKMVVPVRGS